MSQTHSVAYGGNPGWPNPIAFATNAATYALHCPVCRRPVAQMIFPWGSRFTLLSPCCHTINGHALRAEMVS